VNASLGKTVDGPFEHVVQRAESALASEGFGILTRIDVQATLREKLGEEMAPYVILGACNPPLAHRALSHEPEVGVFLPCNVVVRAEPDGRCVVQAMNAGVMSEFFSAPELGEVAREVMERLERVLDGI
jgi:uncharacterized protein (DUF302 family)